MTVIVVTLFVVVGEVFEVAGGRSEVERWVRVGPKLCPLSCPPHCL